MSGWQMFEALAVVFWPIAMVGFIRLRRRVQWWLFLERLQEAKLTPPVESQERVRKPKARRQPRPTHEGQILITFPTGEAEVVSTAERRVS